MSVILPSTSQAIGPVSAFNLIKAIEALGGSRGYLEHVKNAQSGGQIAQPLSLLSVSNFRGSDGGPRERHNCSIQLRAGIVPGVLFGKITVFSAGTGIPATRFAYIKAWVTEGEGYTDLHGTVVLDNWEDMCKAPTQFVIIATDKKGIHGAFSRDHSRIADISANFPEACGVQAGSYICEGECTWEEFV